MKNGPCLFRVDHFGAQELCPQGWAPCSSHKDRQSQAPWQELSSVNTTGKEQLPRMSRRQRQRETLSYKVSLWGQVANNLNGGLTDCVSWQGKHKVVGSWVGR